VDPCREGSVEMLRGEDGADMDVTRGDEGTDEGRLIICSGESGCASYEDGRSACHGMPIFPIVPGKYAASLCCWRKRKTKGKCQ